MVFVVSYSIAAYSIMFPKSELSFVLIYNVMRLGYWNLYGELFLEDIESKLDFLGNSLDFSSITFLGNARFVYI